jgi:hypothetical protein
MDQDSGFALELGDRIGLNYPRMGGSMADSMEKRFGKRRPWKSNIFS